jgi:hypothetical protein
MSKQQPCSAFRQGATRQHEDQHEDDDGAPVKEEEQAGKD